MVEIIDKLAQALPLHLYGQGDADTFDDLINEIKFGESHITFDAKGIPTRNLSVSLVKILYFNKTLVEIKHIYKDGRVRERGTVGLSEKSHPNETPLATALRAIDEELKLDPRDFALIESSGISIEEKISLSYPGLKSQYTFHKFTTCMPVLFYREEYITKEKTKTLYFGWKSQ